MSTPPFVALPAGIERLVIAGQGGDLACLIAVPQTSPIGSAVLVPGLTGSKEDFIAVMPLLLARGWAVATLDLRGQYQSRCRPETRFDFADFGSDALALMTVLRERTGQDIHLLGHSFGGLVARRVAIDLLRSQRDEQRPRLRSLTLLASGPAALPTHVHGKLAPLIDYLPGLSLTDLWTAKEALDRADGWVPPSPEVAEFLRVRFISNDPRSVRAKAMLLMRAPDEVDALRQVLELSDVPVSVIYGEHDDAWTPSEQEQMSRRLGARRLVLPRTGHSPNVEVPELLAAELHGFWLGAGAASTEPGASPGESVPIRHKIETPPFSWAGYPARSEEHIVGLELRIPATVSPAGVRSTRRSIQALLQQCGSSARVSEVELVLAELLTNAVRHGDAPLEVRLLVTADAFRLEVYDAKGTAEPVHRRSAELRPGGHGLSLVSTLSRAWGVTAEGTGKIVWAEIARDTGFGHS